MSEIEKLKLQNELHDFDSFWGEEESKAIKFKLFGVEEELPPSLPAKALLKIVRAQRESGGLQEMIVFEIAMSIFGEEKVDEWASKGLSVKQLTDMLNWAVEKYNVQGTSSKSKKNKKK